MKDSKQKLIIGVDASRSVDLIQKTGVEKVSDELLKEFDKFEGQDFEFIFYTPQKISWLSEKKQKIIKMPGNRFWTLFALSVEMLKNKPDVFFTPASGLPFFVPKRTFSIIHDIEFKIHKESYSCGQRFVQNFYFWRAIKKCKKIFTVTDKVKEDILRNSQLKDEQVVVVPHGYNSQKSKVKSQKSKEMILFIGRVEEKKNLENLLRAFELFNKKFEGYKLVLVGKMGVGGEKIKALAERLGDKVVLASYVSEEEKQKYLAQSQMLIHVSKNEGFCLPALEAFDHDLPVVLADVPVLHEVADGAALYVAADRPADIALKMEQLATDGQLRDKLINKGRQRLLEFAWQKAADKYCREFLKLD